MFHVFTRTEMIEVLDSDYMILAKAKGLDRKTLIFSHALRNALIPVITILGPILVNLMTGTMVVELLCSVPGLGKLLVNSILSSDYNIILACAFLYAAMYIIMMLVIDIAYGIIDPRIRLGRMSNMTEMQALQEMKFQPKDFEFAHESQELEKDEVMPARSAWKDSVSLFVRNKGAVIGIVCIALITIFAIVAPMLSGWKYDAIDTSLQNIAPGAQHWFGTDNYGRDLWVRLWQGTRISLFVAVAAIFIDVVIGVTYGMISGYFGGKVDSVMQRIQEVINSIPTLVILTILLMVMKSSLFNRLYSGSVFY
mgnify:CR=1 FL=1